MMKNYSLASLLKHTKRIRIGLIAVVLLALVTLYVLNASTPGRMVEACPQDCAVDRQRAPGPLRIISLNMLHGFPRFEHLELRMDLIVGEIQRLDADVILLQEVPWTTKTGNVAEYLAEQLGYNYAWLRANGNHSLIFFEEGEAIISRFPLKDIVYGVLPPRVGLFQNRVVLGATASTPRGDIRLFSTHLTHSDPSANGRQVEELHSFVNENSREMAVVAGDFNAWEDTPQIQDLARIWVDTYRTAHPEDTGLTCCVDDLKAAPGEPLEMRIDYIFLVHPGGTLVSAEHAFYRPFQVSDGWQWASDHTGLIIELEP